MISISEKELVVGTVVITTKGEIAVITEHKTANLKYPYIYKKNVKGSSYKGSIDGFKCVVGEVDVVDFAEACDTHLTPQNKNQLPEELRDFNIGDDIIILGSNGVEQVVEYRGYNPRRPKNCVSIRINGKEYKGPLSIVVGKA
jgi:hypothetical protein